MNNQIESYYPLIGQAFFDALPDFSESWLSIEMIDDVWGAEAFYLTSNRVDGDSVRYTNRGLNDVEQLFLKMRKTFRQTGMQPFTQATFWLSENGKFSIEFGYEDVSDFGLSGERREAWIKKHLGENAIINWGESL